MYHTIEGNFNIESTYDEIFSAISNYLSTNDVNSGPKYNIISLPSAVLFGRAQPRNSNNKRETNHIIGVTSESMKDYIDYCGVVEKEKKVFKAAATGKKKKALNEPRIVSIDLACVVQELEEDSSTVGDSSIPRSVRAKKTYPKIIPPNMIINVLNPVMTVNNEKECSTAYMTSTVTPLGSFEMDMRNYISIDDELYDGKFWK